MGEKNGVPFNLLENQEDQYYVTFEGSKTTNQEYLTGIFDTQYVENVAQRVVFDGAQWRILGENITDLVLCSVDGKQLLSIKNSANLTAPVVLPIHTKDCEQIKPKNIQSALLLVGNVIAFAMR